MTIPAGSLAITVDVAAVILRKSRPSEGSHSAEMERSGLVVLTGKECPGAVSPTPGVATTIGA